MVHHAVANSRLEHAEVPSGCCRGGDGHDQEHDQEHEHAHDAGEVPGRIEFPLEAAEVRDSLSDCSAVIIVPAQMLHSQCSFLYCDAKQCSAQCLCRSWCCIAATQAIVLQLVLQLLQLSNIGTLMDALSACRCWEAIPHPASITKLRRRHHAT